MVFKRVAVRSGPSTKHPIVGVRNAGDTLTAVTFTGSGWIQLAAADVPAGAGSGWMLTDGAAVGLGVLMQPCMPVPTVVFCGSRALVVEWPQTASGAPSLEVTAAAAAPGETLSCPQHPAEASAAGMVAVRVVGLTPGTELAVRLVSRVGAGSHRSAGEWAAVRTRPSRATPVLLGLGDGAPPHHHAMLSAHRHQYPLSFCPTC